MTAPYPLSEEEFRDLPRWALVAVAVRAAKRVKTLFHATWPDAPKEHVWAVSNAIDVAERATKSKTRDVLLITESATAASAASHAAAGNVDASAFSATAASLAASAAAQAETEGCVDASISASQAALASLNAASVFYVTRMRSVAAELTRNAIRADYKRLLKRAREEGWTDDTLVPERAFGPLWPNGEPDGWPAKGGTRDTET